MTTWLPFGGIDFPMPGPQSWLRRRKEASHHFADNHFANHHFASHPFANHNFPSTGSGGDQSEETTHIASDHASLNAQLMVHDEEDSAGVGQFSRAVVAVQTMPPA